MQNERGFSVYLPDSDLLQDWYYTAYVHNCISFSVITAVPFKWVTELPLLR